MLTQEELKSIITYNPDTGEFYRDGILYRPKDNSNYFDIRIKNKCYHAHRLAFLYMEGYFPTGDVDHINRIKGDNRWFNLRKATRPENVRNSQTRKDNTSGYKGVSWSKQKQKWRVKTLLNGKEIYLGCYDNLEEAGKVYQEFIKDKYKSFAPI